MKEIMKSLNPGDLILIKQSLMDYESIGILIEKKLTKWSSDHIFLTILTIKGNLKDTLVLIHRERDIVVL